MKKSALLLTSLFLGLFSSMSNSQDFSNATFKTFVKQGGLERYSKDISYMAGKTITLKEGNGYYLHRHMKLEDFVSNPVVIFDSCEDVLLSLPYMGILREAFENIDSTGQNRIIEGTGSFAFQYSLIAKLKFHCKNDISRLEELYKPQDHSRINEVGDRVKKYLYNKLGK